MKNCLYCYKPIRQYSASSLFLEEDCLCPACRKKMSYRPDHFKIGGLEVFSFYEYDSLFKDILLQYKECMDEALCQALAYRVCQIVSRKFFSYQMIYIPSTSSKREKRGFDHLELIYHNCSLERIPGLFLKEEITQKGKNRKQREQMITNYCYVGERRKKILIVDDVCTTGSSLFGAYNALKDHAECVKAVVLAKVKKGLTF